MSEATISNSPSDDDAMRRIRKLGYLEITETTRGWAEELLEDRDPESELAVRAQALLDGKYKNLDAALAELDGLAEAHGFLTHREFSIDADLDDAIMSAEADYRDGRISIERRRDLRITAHTAHEHRLVAVAHAAHRPNRRRPRAA